MITHLLHAPQLAGWGLAVAAGLATYLGGRIGLRLPVRNATVLGLCGGMVMGIALLDVLGEALTLAAPSAVPHVLLALVLGYICYLLLDRAVSMRAGLHGKLAPLPLTLHSVIDGLSMGISFALSAGVGYSVSFAVIAHDVADGLNTVSMAQLDADSASLAGRRTAHRWLIANALAPLLGFWLGGRVSLPPGGQALALAFFAGGLLFVATGEIVPRALAARRGFGPILAIASGAALSLVLVIATSR